MNWTEITGFKHECGSVTTENDRYEDIWDDEFWHLVDLAKEGLIKRLGYCVWAEGKLLTELRPKEKGVIAVSIDINKNGTIIGYSEYFIDDSSKASRFIYKWGQLK